VLLAKTPENIGEVDHSLPRREAGSLLACEWQFIPQTLAICGFSCHNSTKKKKSLKKSLFDSLKADDKAICYIYGNFIELKP
jgi:hypothetical protein